MSGTPPNHVCAGMADGQAVIKIEGPCTFSLCDRVRRWLEQISDTLPADIHFDLSGAERIDSTFAGFLVSLVTYKIETGPPRVHLIAPAASITKALETMSLLSLFDVCEGGGPTPGEWQTLGDTKIGPEEVADLVIDTHEKLIQADDRNAKAFRPVVDRFRAAADRQRSSK